MHTGLLGSHSATLRDLAAHLAGREPCDANARFEELFPAHQELAANASG
jgi:hypothetical protein